MGRLQGKIAFITGAARGQGRSHAVRLAEEGADIIAVDVCRDLETVPYALATPHDLEHTVKLVRDTGRRIVAKVADVRDIHALRAAVDAGVAELGGLDIVIANAGVMHYGEFESEEDDRAWDVAVGVMLTGVRNTIKVTRDSLVAGGRGGSVVLISSTAGMKGMSDGSGGADGYVASKHALIGLMRTYANLLGPHDIRVNTVHPTGVMTPMIENAAFANFVEEHPEIADRMRNILPVPALEPRNISDAIAWLVSDEGRYVTGVALPVDAGFTARM